MPADSILVIITVAIAANLIIMGGLVATLLLRRRVNPANPNMTVEPASYRPAGMAAPADPVAYSDAVIGGHPASPSHEEPSPTVSSVDPTDIRRFRPMMSDEGERGDATIASFFSEATDASTEPDNAPGSSISSGSAGAAADVSGAAGAGTSAAGGLGVSAGASALAGAARDGLSGLDGPLNWEFRLRDENARLTRYRRPVSVVLVELDGLDRLIDRFGPDAADRLIPPVGETLHRLARLTDHVARIAEGRFAVLLPETDDIQAINYVERVRTECDRWLAAGAVAMRLAIGWASPAPGGDIRTAVRLAEDRLDADRKRVGSAGDIAALSAARKSGTGPERPANPSDAAARSAGGADATAGGGFNSGQ